MDVKLCPICKEPHGLSLWQRCTINYPVGRGCKSCDGALANRFFIDFFVFLTALIVPTKIFPHNLWLVGLSVVGLMFLLQFVFALIFPLKKRTLY